MSVTIRDAQPGDEADWRRLWAAYLRFYDTSLADEITDATWKRTLDPASAIFMRVAELHGKMVGFAICITHEGTWVKDPDCYLEDLFVDADVRGHGLGRALLDDLVALCRRNGWARLYWHTSVDNHRARRLYDQYVKTDDHIRYRIAIT